MTETSGRPGIYAFALAGLMPLATACGTIDAGVRARLRSAAASLDRNCSLLAAFRASLEAPIEQDATLVELAGAFSLTLVEILCLRLTMAAEEDVEVGHVIAELQAPLAGHRPTVGLLARAFGTSLGTRAIQVIGHGEAVRHGILTVSADEVPLSERRLCAPVAISLALQGVRAMWPGTRPLDITLPVPLDSETQAAVASFAHQLSSAGAPEVLIMRSGDPLEARAIVHQLCEAMQCPPVLVETDHLDGLAPWLFVHRAVPVFPLQCAPGERRPAPAVPSFPGPTIVMAGIDGEFESDGRRLTDWRVPMPARDGRLELWRRHVPDALARQLADQHRHSASRIAALGREIARGHEDGDPTLHDVRAASRRMPAGLGAMADLVDDEVGDEALVVPAELAGSLSDLVRRCMLRDVLVDGFGPALSARYRPAVRALFVGPSGTGKTLAAGWVATRLGLPLFRVDLASVTSKYIGETEKNISQLLSRAEEQEVVLLFDEADSMFGKRTEVRDAHDRFANAQTNFLLQRLESYDGIVLLTSNSRARFDPAFARRLDLVLEFPSPGAEERRALWLAHLGDRHDLTPAEINRIAAAAEISGGQIRAAVLSAAIHASKHGGALGYGDLAAGLRVEFRKMGRQLPDALLEADAARA